MTHPPDFLYSDCSFDGNYSPEDLAFMTNLVNLKEFFDKLSYICNLQIDGNLSFKDACEQISELLESYNKDIQTILEKGDFAIRTSDVLSFYKGTIGNLPKNSG